jgi:hypothetical protein
MEDYQIKPPDYESGGQEFESLRARQHLAPTFRAKNTAILRNLQGTELCNGKMEQSPPVAVLMMSPKKIAYDWSFSM